MCTIILCMIRDEHASIITVRYKQSSNTNTQHKSKEKNPLEKVFKARK